MDPFRHGVLSKFLASRELLLPVHASHILHSSFLFPVNVDFLMLYVENVQSSYLEEYSYCTIVSYNQCILRDCTCFTFKTCMNLSFVFFALSTAMLFDWLDPMKVLFFVFPALTPPLAFPLNVTLPRAASIELLFLQYGSQLLFPRLNLCKTWLHQPISLVRSIFPCLVTSPR